LEFCLMWTATTRTQHRRDGPHDREPAQPQLRRRQPKVVPDDPLHLMIDCTGLKLFGRRVDEEKHGRTRRSWRKLHLAVDAGTGKIVACLLTDNAADDASQVPALLEAIEDEIASLAADGAYDGEPVYHR
jgi:hypothetical protein